MSQNNNFTYRIQESKNLTSQCRLTLPRCEDSRA